MTAKPKTVVERQLARIHILAKEVGMDDETYRQMLVQVGGVVPPTHGKPSAAQLGLMGRHRVLDHLSRLAGKDPLRPGADEMLASPQLQKLDALLLDAKRTWGYLLSKGERGGPSMLQRITHRDHLRFCTADDLRKLITALEIDKKRREAKACATVKNK